MTEIDKKYAEILADVFTRFDISVYSSNDTDYITIVVEEKDGEKGEKEYIISARLNEWENKRIEVKITEERFRYFASLLFCRENEENNIQFWNTEDIDWTVLREKYTKEQKDYLLERGSIFFNLEVSFSKREPYSFFGVKTKKVQEFIKFIFFKMEELNSLIFDNLFSFVSYVVPLGLVEVFDENEIEL